MALSTIPYALASTATQTQCDQKKSPNVYKSCPKMIAFDTFAKMPKSVGDLGKIIVAKGFKKLPKVQ